MDVLKSFSEKFNGKYIERKYDEFQKVEFEYEGFKIVFDYHINYISGTSHQQKFTRVIAPFLSSKDYKFEIYRNRFVRFFEKIFGSKRFKIGVEDFDNYFIVKTNNEFKTRSLLSDKELRKLIKIHSKINFHISDQKGIWGQKLKKNEFELSFYSEEIIEDINQLKCLLELFQETIKHLVEIYSIQPR
jgi:hypothetical protein